MHRYSDQIVAMICHDTTLAMQRAQALMRLHGTDAIPVGPFTLLHPDLIDAAVNGVTEARAGVVSARDHHNRWVDFLRARGWKAGPRDDDRKTHPALVWWEDLGPGDRDKTRVFLSIVMGLTIDLSP